MSAGAAATQEPATETSGAPRPQSRPSGAPAPQRRPSAAPMPAQNQQKKKFPLVLVLVVLLLLGAGGGACLYFGVFDSLFQREYDTDLMKLLPLSRKEVMGFIKQEKLEETQKEAFPGQCYENYDLAIDFDETKQNIVDMILVTDKYSFYGITAETEYSFDDIDKVLRKKKFSFIDADDELAYWMSEDGKLEFEIYLDETGMIDQITLYTQENDEFKTEEEIGYMLDSSDEDEETVASPETTAASTIAQESNPQNAVIHYEEAGSGSTGMQSAGAAGAYTSVDSNNYGNSSVDSTSYGSSDASTQTIDVRSMSDPNAYLCAWSSVAYLTREDLQSLDAATLRILRNEIYARHGRKFKSTELQQYFDSKVWYSGTIDPARFQDDMLSQIEKDNIKLIESYEARFK